MNVLREIGRAWRAEMNAADKVRVLLALGFVFGAVSHVGWLIWHGDLWYHGPAPDWAPVFWYSICVIDFVVCWLLLARPRAGIIGAALTMITTLIVNWTQFSTFEFGFNYVLIGLTLFGALVAATAAWLWVSAKWKLSPTSSGRSAG